MKHVVALFLALALVIGCGRPKSAADAAKLAHHGLPGGRLRLRLPEGFVRPGRSLLFVHQELGITLVLLEFTMSRGGDAAVQAMTRGFEKKLMTEPTHEEVERAGGKGLIVAGTGESGRKMRLIALQNGAAAGGVMCSFPLGSAAAVREILDSVWLDAKATFDPLALHGLAMDGDRGMVVWDASAEPMILGEPGVRPPVPPGAATMGMMVAPVAKGDFLDGMIMGVFKQQGLDEDSIEVNAFVTQGTPAREWTANAKQKGHPVRFFATAIEDPEGALVAWGTVGADRPAFIETFRALTRTMVRSPVRGPVSLP